MKTRLLNGEMINLTDFENCISLWFNDRTKHFCLELNAKVIKATKTFKPIEKKLKEFDGIEEE